MPFRHKVLVLLRQAGRNHSDSVPLHPQIFCKPPRRHGGAIFAYVIGIHDKDNNHIAFPPYMSKVYHTFEQMIREKRILMEDSDEECGFKPLFSAPYHLVCQLLQCSGIRQYIAAALLFEKPCTDKIAQCLLQMPVGSTEIFCRIHVTLPILTAG